MAAYRSSQAATVGSGTSVTVTKPTDLAAGDLLIAFCGEANSSANYSTPSGWTAIDSAQPGTFSRVVIFAKVADSSDASASDFTFSYGGSATKLEVVLYAVSGTFASTANIYAYDVLGGTEAVSDTFRTATGITPASANSLLIMFFYILCDDSDNNAISAYALQTNNPTWTERHDIQDAGGTNTIRIGTATATRTETTDTGYFQAAVSTGNITAGESIGALIAIQDTSNGSVSPAVVTSTFTVPDPAPSGGASVTVAVVTAAATVPSATATGGTNDALWKNDDKPSAGSITNVDKP